MHNNNNISLFLCYFQNTMIIAPLKDFQISYYFFKISSLLMFRILILLHFFNTKFFNIKKFYN